MARIPVATRENVPQDQVAEFDQMVEALGGVPPYGPGSVIRPVAANVPVVCGGIEIAPGDVVAADVNGVMAFPRGALPDVIQKIGELGEKETRSRRAIEEGLPLETAYEF